jgi:hypothetical protein
VVQRAALRPFQEGRGVEAPGDQKEFFLLFFFFSDLFGFFVLFFLFLSSLSFSRLATITFFVPAQLTG